MCKIAFTLGPLHFYWYGLIVVAAILAAFLITLWQTKRSGLPLEPAFDLLLWGVPAGIIGARAYYVLANWDLYRQQPLDIFRLWQGGLAVYGALLAFILVLFLYSRRRRTDLWTWADLFTPGIACGQAIGQLANFVNQEAFGFPTGLSWGVYIDYALRPAGYEQFDFFHPVSLYEAAWNLVLFLLLLGLSSFRRRLARLLPPGSIFLLYILLYALGHYYFVGLRLDSEIFWGLRLGQLSSGMIAAAAFVLLVRAARRRPGADDR